MTTDPLAIDVDFSEISAPRETSPKVVEFRERPAKDSRTFRETSPSAPESTDTLAAALGVSQPTIRRWMRGFESAVPTAMLSAGRGLWSALACEMIHDYNDCRLQGQSLDHWIDSRSGIYAPSQTARTEAFVCEAERQASRVPGAIVAASEARSIALTQAQSLQGFAGALLEQVGRHLVANNATATAEQDAINEAAIVASEMAAILREQQLRAKVRAEFEAQQSAAAAATLEQKLSDLRGAS